MSASEPIESIKPTRQVPRWKRRKDARPQELIDAALALFGEFGYAQTRLDDVAGRAGISKGTVYLYFSSKQDLFEAVVRERAVPWLESIEISELGPHTAIEDQLRSFLEWGWQQFVESRLHLIARIVLAESNNFPHLAQVYLREVMGPVHQLLMGLLERGAARGEVQGEVTHERVRALMAPLAWFSIWRPTLAAYSEPPVDESRYVQEAIEMIVRSVVRPSAPRQC
jgi:AcrR family transcriptional regulator